MGQLVDEPGKLPEQFGKYSLLGHLATGGMAEVYLARQAGIEGFEKIVIIKRIRPEMTDGETTANFLDEARLVATLEHPNIAQVYEIGLVNKSYFFVMEYVHGADLRQLMQSAISRRVEVTHANALYVMSQVCAALHYAHEKHDRSGTPLEIIHRDVSPSNVLLSHDGAVKVCDFGIAKATNRTVQTTRGMLKGKFSYMSPEQCRSKPLDRRSDVFSIGILLYELTTLTKLFAADGEFEVLRSIIEDPIEPPSRRMPDYPPELERIVMKALERDPDNRYPTAQAVQIDLEDFAREQKLALSSINLTKLMGQLFEKRVTEWQRAQRSGTPLGAHLIDTSLNAMSGDFPQFLPIGSGEEQMLVIEETEPPTDVQGRRLPTPLPFTVAEGSDPPSRRSSPAIPVVGVPRPARPSAMWLIGAVLAGLVAGAVTVAGNVLSGADARSQRAALEGDAERVSSLLDAGARAAHMRADSIATTPVLRNAIETDAETLRDLFANEMMFSPGPGDELELFQLGSGQPTSAVRVPASSPPLPPIKGHEAQLDVRDGAVIVAVGSPIAGYKRPVAGILEIASIIDLAAARTRLAEHAVQATLTGLAHDVALVGGGSASPGPPISIEITAPGDVKANLQLVVVPRSNGAGLGWVAPTRYASVGLAALLLLVYAIGFRRKGE